MDASVRGVHHVGVHVADMERSIDFYAQVFGFRLVQRFTLGDEDLAFLEVNAARLELIASPGVTGRTTEPGVLDHFALEVHDLDAWLHTLRKHGVAVLDDAPVTVEELSARYLFCVGPDGERIELFSADAQAAVRSDSAS